MCLFISLIFYIIRKNNALETTRKVSCSVICFLMFVRVSFLVIFPVVSVSLSGVSNWPEKMAVIQVIVLVQANHLWVKYLFFRMWCSVGLCLEAVPSRYTTGLQGISEGIVFAFSSWKPTKWKSCFNIIPDHFFFVPLPKNLLLSIIPLSEVHWLFAQG